MTGKGYFLWLMCIWVSLLYSSVNKLYAQRRPYIFEHIGREDGLASNTVPAILQDREGFIWFGTNNGLQRYDGEKFITYHYQPTHTNSLASDIIETLLEDSHGNIWIASSQAVTLFSPKGEKFTRIPLHENQTSNLSFKRWILTECKGRIFLSSLILKDMLYVYDPSQHSFISDSSVNHNKYSGCLPQPTTGPLTGSEPYIYLTDRNGNTWAAGDYLQVRYKGRSDFEMVQSTHVKYGIEYNLIYTILEDREGTLWVGTEKGVYYFNPAKQHFFSVPFSSPDKAAAAVVAGFLETSDGKIWVSSLNQGIAVFNQQFQQVANYPNSASAGQILLAVWCVVEEPGGTIWAGCEGGYLARIYPQSGKIEYFRPPAIEGQTLIKGVIDQEGIIWWGTNKGQVVKHIPSKYKPLLVYLHKILTHPSPGERSNAYYQTKVLFFG
jgi:ligand-binding sensor domain-containing protein